MVPETLLGGLSHHLAGSSSFHSMKRHTSGATLGATSILIRGQGQPTTQGGPRALVILNTVQDRCRGQRALRAEDTPHLLQKLSAAPCGQGNVRGGQECHTQQGA